MLLRAPGRGRPAWGEGIAVAGLCPDSVRRADTARKGPRRCLKAPEALGRAEAAGRGCNTPRSRGAGSPFRCAPQGPARHRSPPSHSYGSHALTWARGTARRRPVPAVPEATAIRSTALPSPAAAWPLPCWPPAGSQLPGGPAGSWRRPSGREPAAPRCGAVVCLPLVVSGQPGPRRGGSRALVETLQPGGGAIRLCSRGGVAATAGAVDARSRPASRVVDAPPLGTRPCGRMPCSAARVARGHRGEGSR